MDDALAGIGRRPLAADLGPGVEISDRVDDPPAEFAVFGTRSEAAMLFERPARQAEVQRSVVKQFGINWESLFRGGSFLFGLATGRDVISAAGSTG